MDLGKRLSGLRKSKKASLRAVAQRCGCTGSYLSQLEKGEARRPSLYILYALADFYQFPSDTLIIEAEKIPKDVYWKIIHNPHYLAIIRNLNSPAAA